MNSKLEKLFQTYELSEKDIHDFLQIYRLLPGYKKTRAVENFTKIMLSVETLREDLYQEHEILFWNTLGRIEEKLKKIKKDLVTQVTKEEISDLRSMF